ncbi:diguanylate phosphodiesterase [Superficieibacter electus]|uniref:Diguanylate phosphodiesterase n=1 Tax=Superficieibacter electus TaxID=2022662 RepID=A0A2P5GUI0_9ENTR|nr:diguanylate phosphodiesterase [Superficieibacter electus]POP50228.1 diguanylate phosphodiesterase [Superficieibacter electus]
MLTTIIYRSHFCDNVPYKALEEMVTAANDKNSQAGVTGILLFNGTHFFQLLEGPQESVTTIYRHICEDERHYNVVELLRDYSPSRRFGKSGMEIFDLREHDRDEVLQVVLDKGTSKYQLIYDDRALQFFRTFVEAREKENYFEIPADDSWDFVSDGNVVQLQDLSLTSTADCSFAFQPTIDPLAQEVVSLEALLRTVQGEGPQAYFASFSADEVYRADIQSKKVAFAMAAALNLGEQTLTVNLQPMTLVKVPGAVNFLLSEIEANGLVNRHGFNRHPGVI